MSMICLIRLKICQLKALMANTVFVLPIVFSIKLVSHAILYGNIPVLCCHFFLACYFHARFID